MAMPLAEILRCLRAPARCCIIYQCERLFGRSEGRMWFGVKKTLASVRKLTGAMLLSARPTCAIVSSRIDERVEYRHSAPSRKITVSD